MVKASSTIDFKPDHKTTALIRRLEYWQERATDAEWFDLAKDLRAAVAIIAAQAARQ